MKLQYRDMRGIDRKGISFTATNIMWHPLANASACPPGNSLECVVGDQIFALYNVAGQFHALDGICPHQGGPLGKGRLSGCVVTCPWHGWQFDVTNGQHRLNVNYRHPAYQTRLVGDIVEIFLSDSGAEQFD
jgi:nitrite reductase/ring-hydroxylating ferredoxin subunit